MTYNKCSQYIRWRIANTRLPRLCNQIIGLVGFKVAGMTISIDS